MDEAQHILKVAGARQLADQMDVIKDIIDTYRRKTSALRRKAPPWIFQQLNSQLARRTRVVEVRRLQFWDWRMTREAFNTAFAHLDHEIARAGAGAPATICSIANV